MIESWARILSDVEQNDPSVARWKIVWEKVQQGLAAAARNSIHCG